MYFHKRNNAKLIYMVCYFLTIQGPPCYSLERSSNVIAKSLLKKSNEERQEFPHTNTIQNDINDESCNDVTLHKCGSSFVQIIGLLNFVSWEKSFEAKCNLRKDFFACMKRETKPCKKYHWKLNQPGFRKKLARSLWSTRGCILGVKSPLKSIF